MEREFDLAAPKEGPGLKPLFELGLDSGALRLLLPSGEEVRIPQIPPKPTVLSFQRALFCPGLVWVRLWRLMVWVAASTPRIRIVDGAFGLVHTRLCGASPTLATMKLSRRWGTRFGGSPHVGIGGWGTPILGRQKFAIRDSIFGGIFVPENDNAARSAVRTCTLERPPKPAHRVDGFRTTSNFTP
jgi:hypothetical protein